MLTKQEPNKCSSQAQKHSSTYVSYSKMTICSLLSPKPTGTNACSDAHSGQTQSRNLQRNKLPALLLPKVQPKQSGI